MAFIQGEMHMKVATQVLAVAMCLGLAGQVFATDLKHWPQAQAKNWTR